MNAIPKKLKSLRTIIFKELTDPESFKIQLLHWTQPYREILFLDSNVQFNNRNQYSKFDYLAACEAFTSIKTDFYNAFDDLQQYQSNIKDWIFGYISYDLKNDVEVLFSKNADHIYFDDLFFFQPKKIFIVKGNSLEMQYLKFCEDEMESDFNEIIAAKPSMHISKDTIKVQQRLDPILYEEIIQKILKEIQKGNIYEANFCMEFYANQKINPLEKYINLDKISKAPFAAYFKNHQKFIMCASPERYLQKTGQTVISQPIKGTSKRFANEQDDEQSKHNLESNQKERSENIMIVDLVRNDLSKIATKGSVHVEEFCKIYTFKQVHQMISTIKSCAKTDYTSVEVIKNTFPMGSMTGAPKIASMHIIEALEVTKRGVYSGCMGYFTPSGDFDFNVIIRSILYNADNQYISFHVGSAITANAIPKHEYEECLLKAKALLEVLE